MRLSSDRGSQFFKSGFQEKNSINIRSFLENIFTFSQVQGEGGAIEDGVSMLRRAGSYYVIGYGGQLNMPTLNIIATEINFIGNFVGKYNDLVELMTLKAQGRVTLHTMPYPLDAANDAIHALD